jgi:echinoid protein
VPRVTVNPHNPLNVLKSGDAHMYCSFQANPQPRKISWYRNERLIQTSANHTILQVEPSDAGLYRCEVDNEIRDKHDRPGSAEMQLNVLYAPIVTVPPLLEPALHEPLQLQCEVDAQPAPDRIAWYRTSGPDSVHSAIPIDLSAAKPLAEGPTLNIERLTPADSGHYTCVAVNRLAPNDRAVVYTRSANASTEVRVQHAPTRVRINPSEASAIAGRPYQLTCSAEPSAYPLPKYRWWRENDEPTTLSTVSNLTMVTVHVRQEGRYFCQAENALGRSEPASVQLIVQELPSITIPMNPEWIKKQGERAFSLTCRARGKPTPSVTWLHDGQIISAQANEQTAMHRVETVENVDNVHSVQSVLYFESPARRNGDELLAADHGRYQCAFLNSLSNEPVRAETYLRIEHSPVLKHLHNRVAFDLNQSAVLRCEMSAYPPPSFEWYFENRLLDARAGKYSMNATQLRDDVWLATIVVHALSSNDYGEYTCRAWNNVDDDDERTIIKLLERSEPEAPTGVQVLEAGAEYALLGWQAGFDGGYPDTEYVVAYSSQDSRYSRWRNESCRAVNPCKLMGLRSRTNYAFRVTAVNRRGHSLLSDEVRAQTNVSIKDIPSIVDAVFDSFHHMVSFQLDSEQLPLIVKIEARPVTPNKVANHSAPVETVTLSSQPTELSTWQLLLQQPLTAVSGHIVYLPSAQPSASVVATTASSRTAEQAVPAQVQTYAEMRISLCLQFNQSLCGYQQPVKMDLISSLSRENKVYSIDQLVLVVSVGACVALVALILGSFVCKHRDRLAKKKQEFDSESDSDSRSKVNTLGSAFFGAHDNKALVGSNDEPTKMLPPPMYSTSPNTPTASVNAAMNNNLLLNGSAYGGGYAAQNGVGYYMPDDPSPNSSNETAQSDLWVMKAGEMIMPDGTIAYQPPNAMQSAQSELLMNGLSSSYHHLNQPQPTPHLGQYGTPMDYSYSYYPHTQPDDPYPGMGEDAYTIKNSLCKFQIVAFKVTFS